MCRSREKDSHLGGNRCFPMDAQLYPKLRSAGAERFEPPKVSSCSKLTLSPLGERVTHDGVVISRRGSGEGDICQEVDRPRTPKPGVRATNSICNAKGKERHSFSLLLPLPRTETQACDIPLSILTSAHPAIDLP
jgi:hypothetical protein